jgi:hypothetical protein
LCSAKRGARAAQNYWRRAALKITTGEYFAIFDCDHIPPPFGRPLAADACLEFVLDANRERRFAA